LLLYFQLLLLKQLYIFLLCFCTVLLPVAAWSLLIQLLLLLLAACVLS
jgi:hypothetical protein